MSSQARKMRRAATRERLTASRLEPLHYVGIHGDSEWWRRGDITFVVPKIPDGAHTDVANAIDRRRRAAFTGRCDCGARVHVTARRLVVDHEHDCTASDAAIRELLRRHGTAA